MHTSVLRRAIRTASSRSTPPTGTGSRSAGRWRLNERHYGALQGKDKKQTLDEFGEEQFMLWRRSYDIPPPPIDDDDEFSQVGDPRYADLAPRCCRAPSASRTSSSGCCPTGTTRSSPDLRAGQTVLVAAHGNSLRALVKHLDGISDDDIAGLNIPTGIPLRLRASTTTCGRPSPGGEYLDPEAAAAATAAVANQGR